MENKINKINKKYSDQIIYTHLSIDIIWESLGHKYIPDPNLVYTIFINGCFCPPHKGHIESIKNAIEVFGPNTNIIVNQLGYSKRHGVPSEISKYMMQFYIEKIFGLSNKLKLFFREPNKNIFKNELVLNSDVVVFVRGDELGLDEHTNINIKLTNEYYIYKSRQVIKFLNKKGIKVDFLLQTRPINQISSTIFVKKLMDVSKGVIKDTTPLFEFMPNELTLKDKIYLIKKIILNLNLNMNKN